jgi:hypothetical protein
MQQRRGQGGCQQPGSRQNPDAAAGNLPGARNDDATTMSGPRGAASRLLAAVLGAAALAVAAGPALVRPSPQLSAAEVVTIQLEALQHNDEPYIDAGIAQSWLLAHPANKRVTGPYSRFADMLRSPAFAAILDH